MPEHTDPARTAHVATTMIGDLVEQVYQLQARERRLLNLARRVAAGECCLEGDAARLIYDLEGGVTERPELAGVEF